MKLPEYKKSYESQTKNLLTKHSRDRAMSLAVGGDFEAVGKLEFYLLKQMGLTKDHLIIDVGCGSGRLASQLSNYLGDGKYVGIDVVQDLVDYAEDLSGREDWEFYVGPGLKIPENDASADFICFFSVFTHLLHEETFKYIEDAARVLKREGKIIFSFLEFRIKSHWAIFEQVLEDDRPDKVLNQFISRDLIEAFADHSNLRVQNIYDGDRPHIVLDEVIRWDNGTEMHDIGTLGQSVCVLTRQ